MPIRNGEFTLHQWVYDTPEVAYLVSYIDYHRGHVANNGLQFVLNDLTKGLHTNRTPISEKHITHGGYATRDVVVRDNAERPHHPPAAHVGGRPRVRVELHRVGGNRERAERPAVLNSLVITP